MKSKFNQQTFSFLILIFLFLPSCGKQNDPPFTSTDRSSYTSYNLSPIQAEGIESFVVSQEGDVTVSTSNEQLTKYDSYGQTKSELSSNGAFYGNLCYDNEKLYAYDYNTSSIVELTSEEPRVITNSILFHTIRNMVALDENLYVLAIPFTSENTNGIYGFGKEDFEYYGEQVYCIDTTTGNYRTLSLDNITAEYRSEAGELYFYGWKEDKYSIYKYDPRKQSVSEQLHHDNMGNFLSIVVENERLFGITNQGLLCINLTTGESEELGNWYAMYGNDLQFTKGNLYVNALQQKSVCRVAFLSPEGIILQDAENNTLPSKDMNTANPQTPTEDIVSTQVPTDQVPTEFPKRTERISVQTTDKYNLFYTDAIRKLSGMKTKWVETTDYEVLITEMMAGNPEIDIYILGTDAGLSLSCRDLGIYEPLNSSSLIKDYLDQCFDYVKESALLENGNIWMLPLYAYVDTTWYVPENMEHFRLTEKNLDTVDHYLDTLRSLQGNLGDYRYYNYSDSFIIYCNRQYDFIFNDHAAKKINYRTDVYRNMMKQLWDGWEMYSSYLAENPLFYSVLNDYPEGSHRTVGEGFDYDTDRVIFKTRNAFEWLSNKDPNTTLTGWRIMGAPCIADASEQQAAPITFALVNPYSKQKEAAIAYLEAVISNPETTIINPVFFKKGMENYADQYDISLPAFQDLYHIYENLGVYYGHLMVETDSSHILEYQQGLISFDQAIERVQSIAEAELYE